jgi:hypothetical protein
MNIRTALEKIDSLSIEELRHMSQLCEIEIINCERFIKNYNERMMERYGLPHLNRLKMRKSAFDNRIITFDNN